MNNSNILVRNVKGQKKKGERKENTQNERNVVISTFQMSWYDKFILQNSTF